MITKGLASKYLLFLFLGCYKTEGSTAFFTFIGEDILWRLSNRMGTSCKGNYNMTMAIRYIGNEDDFQDCIYPSGAIW